MAFGSGNTSHSAHVGGFVTGLLGGIAIGKNYEVLWYEVAIQIASLVALVGAWAACIAWMATAENGPQNLWEDCGWCWVRSVADPTISGSGYACVKCGTKACIDYWTDYCSTHFSCSSMNVVSAQICIDMSAKWLEESGFGC
jgi:hypothetical protein